MFDYCLRETISFCRQKSRHISKLILIISLPVSIISLLSIVFDDIRFFILQIITQIIIALLLQIVIVSWSIRQEKPERVENESLFGSLIEDGKSYLGPTVILMLVTLGASFVFIGTFFVSIIKTLENFIPNIASGLISHLPGESMQNMAYTLYSIHALVYIIALVTSFAVMTGVGIATKIAIIYGSEYRRSETLISLKDIFHIAKKGLIPYILLSFLLGVIFSILGAIIGTIENIINFSGLAQEIQNNSPSLESLGKNVSFENIESIQNSLSAFMQGLGGGKSSEDLKTSLIGSLAKHDLYDYILLWISNIASTCLRILQELISVVFLWILIKKISMQNEDQKSSPQIDKKI